MDNQKIFEFLAEAECTLYYAAELAYCTDNYETVKAAHEAAKKALEAFANATGCHN